ncbi:putative C2H2 finger domain protein (Ezf) [Aspergillus undulatus]|uniref:putative C2H2 finger domain protein (Ezf) n=1 Tax=Aspergillus undulatus TaxID=1810928 RepID=UPI003CCCF655
MSTTDIEPRTYPAYSDPFRVTAASPFQRVNHGLGITYCETKPSASHMQDFQSSEHYAPDWADQLMPSALHYGCGHNNNNNNNHISPIAFYERYPGSDASVSPLSHCVPRAISVSPSRGSALEFQAAPEAMNMQAYNFLPNTPHSDTDVIIKEDPDAELHAEFQDGLYLECTKPVSMPLFAPVAQYRTTDFWPKLECPEEDDFSEPTVIDRDGEPSLSAESSVFSVGTNSPWIGGDNALLYHEQIKVPPASGTECGICGAKFTRRSNCREHMKRHDPSNRKSYTCETCGKALGRKTDLKRHIDSVHRGIRRFACDQCGARFSRQDTLARHGSDGCRRNGRRPEHKSS